MLCTEYKNVKMKNRENISEMYANFSNIRNNAKALSKFFPNIELIKKILSSLLKLFKPNIMMIQEAKDQNKLTLETTWIILLLMRWS